MDSKKEDKHKNRSSNTNSATSKQSQSSASTHHGGLRRSSSSSNLNSQTRRERRNPNPRSPVPPFRSTQEWTSPSSPGSHLAQLFRRSTISDRSRSSSRSGSRQASTATSSTQQEHRSTRAKSPAPADRSGGKSKDFSLLDAASSPLLSLRKRTQAEDTKATTQSSARLNKHLNTRSSTSLKQQQQQQQEKGQTVDTSRNETSSSDNNLTCPTCGTQLPSRDSYKRQYVNAPFLALHPPHFSLSTQQHDAYVVHRKTLIVD